MARIRTIKPEVAQSESLGRVTRDARLLFILLWTIADDEGRLRGNPAFIAGTLFPYDGDSREIVEPSLKALEKEGMIRRYVVEGDSYIEISNWAKHQRVEKPTASKIPPFEPNWQPFPESSPNPPVVVGEASSLARVKDQDQDQEGNRKGEEIAPKRQAARFTPPSLGDLSVYMAELGMPPHVPQKFLDYYEAQGWKLSNGQKMVDWRAACRTWHSRENKNGSAPKITDRPVRLPA